ncbi:MAG: hypothetical protein KDD56_08795 [Bdellovibrionales bacterium]|nr:hypothetical protein [Bdellovibrionales bacterium]
MEDSSLFQQKAFSLFDLLVTLALASTAIAISIPALSEIYNYNQAKLAAKSVAEFIEQQILIANANESIIRIQDSNRLIAQNGSSEKSLTLNNINLRFASNSQSYLKIYSNEVSYPGTILVESENENVCAVVLSLRNRTKILC